MKKLVAVVQLALAVGLIAFLFYRMDNRSELMEAVRSILGHWGYLVGALLLAFACLMLCALRWNLIMQSYAIRLPFREVFQLYFVGHFFNAFMFGAVGGDLIKAIYVARAVPGRRTEAIATIFIDRLIGLLALVFLVGVVICIRFRFFLRYPETQKTMAFMIAVLAATVTGLFVAFRQNLLERFGFFRRLEESTAIGRVVGRVYGAFHHCLSHRGLMVRTLGLSLLTHTTLVAAGLLLGVGLGIRTTGTSAEGAPVAALSGADWAHELGNYMTVFPIVNGIAAIPATPGGLGTRDMATKFLLGVPEFGVPATRAVPLSLLLYLAMFFWSLFGGIVYMFYVAKAGRVSGNELADASG
jgi:glycosyltransferase 2 family protein